MSFLKSLSLTLFTVFVLVTRLHAAAVPPLRPAANTTLGLAVGSLNGNVARYTLPFAQPPVGGLRFANPQPPSKFNGTYDASSTPPSCYGDISTRGGNALSEDCLYFTVYTPTGGSKSKGVLVWLYGGSFIGGSSTAAGLDASKLAASQDIVVIVPQYRVGLFGFFQNAATLDETNGGKPNATKVAGNQAVRDVVAALGLIKQNAAAFNGDPSKITIAGQSSGAHIVRTLLTTPAAQSLFARAAMFSDVQDYGLSNTTQAAELTDFALADLGCTTLDCARASSADDVLSATFDAFSTLPNVDPTMPLGEPFRPTLGKYIPRSFERGLAANTLKLTKPLLLSTVQNDAGSQIGNVFEPTPAGATTLTLRANGFQVDFPTAASLIFNAGRGYTAATSKVYGLNTTTSGQDALRSQLEVLSSDGFWRCSAQYNAVNAKRNGAQVWLAQTNVGATYPSNSNIDYCQKPNVVCHEDDIYLIFGSYPSSEATTAVKAVSAEWQARLAAFVNNGNPNTGSYAGWSPVASATSLNLLVLGSNTATGKSAIHQTQHSSACGPSGIWGRSVPFDWQLYHA
ncbi:hypothetical protein OC845_001990 [Tilletia horrida]|nr:hypothetical protein OC845_001990 [Tilletia horrida]